MRVSLAFSPLRYHPRARLPGILSLAALGFAFPAAPARADQTISTAVTGPIYGGNAGITVTPTGSVTNGSGPAFATNGKNTITFLTNSGSVSGSDFGLSVVVGQTVGSVTNAGSFTGGTAAISSAGQITTLTNDGVLSGSGNTSIENTGTIISLVNSATITGPNAVANHQSGVIRGITNTGSIDGIWSYGSIGPATVSGDPVISSTGAGATIGGLIMNGGNVTGDIVIENEDLAIQGPKFGEGVGTFAGGTIEVRNGSLMIDSGVIGLSDDVIVSSAGGVAGAGTMTNGSVVFLGGTRSLNGSFSQTAAAGLLIDLDESPNLSYGSLAVSGSASFDGFLDLQQSAHALAAGDSMELFTFASSVGEFAGLLVDLAPLTSLGGGRWSYDSPLNGSLILTEVWSATSFRIDVTAAAVPEIDPAGLGSVLALACGSLSLLERRRVARRSPRVS